MSPLIVILLIVLIDLLGFTLVMPLLPPFAEQYGFSKAQIGLLLAAYPMCQLVAGPILGRLSDRYGRRPVLAVSQAGTALSFVILGLSQDYTIMLLARMLDGASGGNILVAQAYVADVTRPEDRAKGLGMIGAAFGLGFVLGPVLGGLLLSLPVADPWRLRSPFLVAAVLSSLAWILVLLRLPESSSPETRKHARVLSWRGLIDAVTLPSVGLLVAIGALNVLAFAALEGTFSLYLQERMGWKTSHAAYAFGFLGLVSAVVQGGLIRRWVPKYGEVRLIITGLGALSVGLAGLALIRTTPGLVAAMLIVGLGQGMAGPSISGLLSRITPASEQGAIFGTLSSAQTLARMVNYLLANWLLGRLGPASPFWEGAGVALLALLLSLAVIARRFGTEPRVGKVSELGEVLDVGTPTGEPIR
jgi:DHA1 family tetracycline resistance protein-like MFS transporter